MVVLDTCLSSLTPEIVLVLLVVIVLVVLLVVVVVLWWCWTHAFGGVGHMPVKPHT